MYTDGSEKIIRVDMDGVIADLNTPWLDRINAEHGCNVLCDDITDWDMSHFLPKAAKDYHKHLHDLSLYDEVQPYPDALKGIKTLRSMGYKVLFVTSSTPAGAYGKMLWLKRHGFTPEHEYIPADFISAHKKHYVMPGTPIVDDGLHNLKDEEQGILMDRPWNRQVEHPRRAKSWDQVINIVQRLEAMYHPVWGRILPVQRTSAIL